MGWLEFIYNIYAVTSINIIVAFILYIAWRYIDLKYFSTFDVETLKQENEYLKRENQKLNGTSTNFWDSDNV